MSETVIVQSLMMRTSIVSEESLARVIHTHTHTHTHTDGHWHHLHYNLQSRKQTKKFKKLHTNVNIVSIYSFQQELTTPMTIHTAL